MKKHATLVMVLAVGACSQAGETTYAEQLPVMILTCSGASRATNGYTPDDAPQRQYRFDETNRSLGFWFDQDRSWGVQSVFSSTASFDVRDDFMIWRAFNEQLGWQRTIRFDRVTGSVEDTLNYGNSENIYTGQCVSQIELAQTPLSADQRAF
jgi:hypothetical protein